MQGKNHYEEKLFTSFLQMLMIATVYNLKKYLKFKPSTFGCIKRSCHTLSTT